MMREKAEGDGIVVDEKAEGDGIVVDEKAMVVR